ncbi:MAG: hypothetical protein ABIK47_02460 [candidate division WOR-3 bacterium]
MTERKVRMNGLICLPFCLHKTEDRRPRTGGIPLLILAIYHHPCVKAGEKGRAR